MKPPMDNGSILITGASSGIGLELARGLAGLARALVLVARRGERLEQLRDELAGRHPDLKVSVQACDLLDPGQTDRMLEAARQEVGEIDVLVNNAGFGDMGLFELSDWDKLERMMRLNMLSLAYLTRRLVGGMLQRRRGGILNVSSGFGLTFMPGAATYVGTKHFVTSFTECLRLELRGTGVVVSQLCPGPVATEFLDVAGNPSGQKIPGFIEISAAQCAREAIAGFARGRALIVPGLVMKLVTWAGRLSPRWLLRLLYLGVGRFLRKQQRPGGSEDQPDSA